MTEASATPSATAAAAARRKHMLVSPAELESQLADPQLRVLDCSVHLESDGERSGHDIYQAGHVPGAAFMDVLADLSDPESDLDFTLPSLTRLRETLARVGISNASSVVLYSGTDVMWATRVWWILRYLGHDRAGVLDGGLRRWRAEGRPLTTAGARADRYPPADFEPRPHEEVWATTQDVSAQGVGRARERASRLDVRNRGGTL